MSPILVQETSESSKRRNYALTEADKLIGNILYQAFAILVSTVGLLITLGFAFVTPYLAPWMYVGLGISLIPIGLCPIWIIIDIRLYRTLRKEQREMDAAEVKSMLH